jgi:peptide/nickel transport system ATP-binding protein
VLLEISKMSVSYKTILGEYKVIDSLDFKLEKGEKIAIVGESASGKSTLGLVIAGMLPPNSKTTGAVMFEGRDMLRMNEKEKTYLRGTSIFMIFQNPLNSLNPVKNVEYQLMECVSLRNQKLSINSSRETMLKEVNDTLVKLRMPDPSAIMRRYPHELSGGQVQRIVIAMALILKPKLLIADEPTTALDVTIQAQFLELIRELNSELGMSIIFITHDIALANVISDKLMVFYGGRVVETGKTTRLINEPKHPYTVGLIKSIPSSSKDKQRLFSIIGAPPAYLNLPNGCKFSPRCNKVMNKCILEEPKLTQIGEDMVRCWLYE